MQTFKKTFRYSLLIAMAWCLLSTGAFAEALDSKAPAVVIEAHRVEWTVPSGRVALALTLSGPNGVSTQVFSAGDAPELGLYLDNGQPLPQGSYTWELKSRITRRVDAGQVDSDAQAQRPWYIFQSGYLTVGPNGFMPQDSIEPDPSTAPRSIESQNSNTSEEHHSNSQKDFPINDDLIVDGGACIGLHCAFGESFATGPLRLKQDIVRLEFQDTSLDPGFPSNSWQITVNDPHSGGGERFSIDDVDGATTPFTLEAGAPDHALYVDDTGRLGLSTSTPMADVHIADGNTPTLRLEQDSSEAQTPWTWEIGGNDSAFAITDVTNGSATPFRIEPGAPSDSIFVDADGKIGMQTDQPRRQLTLHSRENAGIELYNTEDDVAWFLLNDSLSDALLISRQSSGGAEVRIDSLNDGGSTGITMWVSGSITAAAELTALGNVNGLMFVPTSTRDAKDGFRSVDTQDILDKLDRLDIQTWHFKHEDSETLHMGPIAEDFAAIFGLGATRKGISTTDSDGVALAAIQALHEQLKTLRSSHQNLQQQNLELQQRLDALESR